MIATVALEGATTLPGVLIEAVICPLVVAAFLGGAVAVWRASLTLTEIKAWIKRADHILFPIDGPGLPETVRGILTELRGMRGLAETTLHGNDHPPPPT